MIYFLSFLSNSFFLPVAPLPLSSVLHYSTHSLFPLSSPPLALPPSASSSPYFPLCFSVFVAPAEDDMVDIFKSSPCSPSHVMEGLLGSAVLGPLSSGASWGGEALPAAPFLAAFDLMSYIRSPWIRVYLLRLVKEGGMHQVWGSSDRA